MAVDFWRDETTVSQALPLPPSGILVIDPITGGMDTQWQNYFLMLTNAISTIGAAPADARYWVAAANGQLPNETNMGALASGYLKETVAAGIATPSTVATIPGTDISGSALTKTDDTNVTLTLGGTPLTGLLRAISLTLGWTGLLGLARGGVNADLSGTGGTSRFLRQNSAGAAITVVQPSTADLSDYASTTWTATDGSGAGLSLTVTSATYVRVGNLVFFELDVTYPATADGTAASVTGLPFAAAKQYVVPGRFTVSTGTIGQIDSGGSRVRFTTAAGTDVTNVALSTGNVRVSGCYST